MSWLVLITAIFFAVRLAAALVARSAAILTLIPWAAARRWLVIIAAISLLMISFCAVAFAISENGPVFFGPWFRTIRDYWVDIPTTTILLVAVATSFVLTLVVLTIIGYFPVKDQPYLPRAAHWDRRSLRRRSILAFLFLLCALVLQDLELRWRLRRMEASAIDLVQSITPAQIPDSDNAATHYQELMGQTDTFENLNKELRAVYAGLDLCACNSDARKAYFRKVDETLAPLYKASEYKACRFDDKHTPIDLLDATQMRVDLISACEILKPLAKFEICEKRPAEALKLLKRIRQLEGHLSQDLRGMQTVFYFWLDAWLCHTVEQLATYCESIPMEEARSLIAKPLDTNAISRVALTWEAAVFQMHIVKSYDGRNFDKFGRNQAAFSTSIGRSAKLAIMRFLFARDDMDSIRVYFPFLTQPNSPEAWVNRYYDYEDIRPRGFLLSSIVTSSWNVHWIERANIWRQSTNCALAAAFYRQTHGRWPRSNDELATVSLPVDLNDPQSSQPYLWINLKDGLIIYSSKDAEAFKDFSDSVDTWERLNKHSFFDGAIFLGEAYKKYAAARYANPNDPCSE